MEVAARPVKRVAVINPKNVIRLPRLKDVNVEMRKKRVCGYARVSTDEESQTTSYNAQVDYYKKFIKSNPEWEYVDLYSDEGITGTSTKKRDGFNRMIKDALDGKIDLIVTKSISRFARNTVDSLQTIRQLKEKGVEVLFEKENIRTFDTKGELLLTILSSLAQEEARSISENTTWGLRKRFQDGKYSLAYTHFLGYDVDKNGNMIVNKEQAKVVKLIYELFLNGYTLGGICEELENRKIKTPYGLDRWHKSTVKSILRNEKYKGDALLQKTYRQDFLTKKVIKNHGEIPQYYIENGHEGIISKEQFALVQEELLKRGHLMPYKNKDVFAGRLICGHCGEHLVRLFVKAKKANKDDSYKYYYYICRSKRYKEYKNDKCKNKTWLKVEKLKEEFVIKINEYIKDKKEIIKNFDLLVFDENELIEKKNKIAQNLNKIQDELDALIDENSCRPKNQKEWTELHKKKVKDYKRMK